jgi:hypothetical protein
LLLEIGKLKGCLFDKKNLIKEVFIKDYMMSKLGGQSFYGRVECWPFKVLSDDEPFFINQKICGKTIDLISLADFRIPTA